MHSEGICFIFYLNLVQSSCIDIRPIFFATETWCKYWRRRRKENTKYPTDIDGSRLWYRAQFHQKLNEDMVQVGLIDFDVSAVVHMGDIRAFHEQFAYERMLRDFFELATKNLETRPILRIGSAPSYNSKHILGVCVNY